jgi:hypothetical protein
MNVARRIPDSIVLSLITEPDAATERVNSGEERDPFYPDGSSKSGY